MNDKTADLLELYAGGVTNTTGPVALREAVALAERRIAGCRTLNEVRVYRRKDGKLVAVVGRPGKNY